MPLYVFSCDTCGEYTRRKSIHDDLSKDNCPTCESLSNRVYTTFMMSVMDKKLSKAIESGMEPRVMRKSELPKSNIKSKNRISRPWMN